MSEQMCVCVLACRENLENLCNKLVARWHYRMINDGARNGAYDRAIAAAVRRMGPQAPVLDIGSGSGLLAMMAARAGAVDVTACDLSSSMISLSQLTLGITS